MKQPDADPKQKSITSSEQDTSSSSSITTTGELATTQRRAIDWMSIPLIVLAKIWRSLLLAYQRITHPRMTSWYFIVVFVGFLPFIIRLLDAILKNKNIDSIYLFGSGDLAMFCTAIAADALGSVVEYNEQSKSKRSRAKITFWLCFALTLLSAVLFGMIQVSFNSIDKNVIARISVWFLIATFPITLITKLMVVENPYDTGDDES